MREKLSKNEVHFFETILSDFHRKAGREYLPWRGKGIGAYEIWVSEIMLQQTQVSRVIGYYKRFLKRFPTVGHLAGVAWEEFLPYYQGLGYYARGRNMLKTAKLIVSEYSGKFPRDESDLETLPGIGPYTAAAIASFAYGQNSIAWDTNLKRVVGRFFFGTKHLSLSRHCEEAKLPRQSKKGQTKNTWIATPRRSIGSRDDKQKKVFSLKFSLPAKTLNAAMMDFGSAVCLSRPKCANCPLTSKCRYFAERGRSEFKNVRTSNIEHRTSSVSWKDAQVFVTLHENHRKYYSPYKTKPAPFVVPVSHNTRTGIKSWFRDRYGLELSVRPPHKKELVDGKPTIFVNAQILAGEPKFVTFQKSEGS